MRDLKGEEDSCSKIPLYAGGVLPLDLTTFLDWLSHGLSLEASCTKPQNSRAPMSGADPEYGHAESRLLKFGRRMPASRAGLVESMVLFVPTSLGSALIPCISCA